MGVFVRRGNGGVLNVNVDLARAPRRGSCGWPESLSAHRRDVDALCADTDSALSLVESMNTLGAFAFGRDG